MKPSSSTSEALFERARGRMPGGVSSPVRAFGKVGGAPRYISRAEGPFMWDEDGNQLLDFCLAWGPNILGHAHPGVVEAVTRTVRDGLAFGTTHRHEVALADLVLEAFPEAQLTRFVVSGTEAVATALRLARGSTGRALTLKFTGCYHGHVDSMLVKAGSGLVTQGLSDSKGVPEGLAATTVVVPLDDEAALAAAFEKYGPQLAAAIVEPLPANNGLLVQRKAWLEALRAHCTRNGTVLIFDEVINGFRFHFGGYGRLMGVKPDLTTLGKILGGGLPVAAVVGTRELLSQLAPLGGVYQAGTMAGNPVALAAGIATLTELKKPGTYEALEALGAHLESRWAQRGRGLGLRRFGSLFWPYLDAVTPPTTAEAIRADVVARYHDAYRGWLDRGVYLPPSGYEVGFLSTAHTTAHVDRLLDVMLEA
ncbi:MAG: glutamate-1-semialdehyde 2,1-aminomutase [Myxococcales bacterium]|nr:glutamate-1-semialdehyde 2,1-aminomutase [Myxococcales bacterium]MDP3503394.1 glutamate-1-semialdehyde 2,1-aminomutase [Myxococcales bacterium]